MRQEERNGESDDTPPLTKLNRRGNVLDSCCGGTIKWPYNKLKISLAVKRISFAHQW